MAVSNKSSNTSALPQAPSAAATHGDSNNIVTKVMNPSLLHWEHAQREECTSKIHQVRRVSIVLSRDITSRDSSILQQRMQSMSQASDFNMVVNISHALHAAPTQWSGKKLTEELHQQ
uniref:Uncharacterized protein n=1 Tax=Oryza rufipogon TaxID=4529 RepID=A0A0E0RGR0_ORYRU